MSSLLTPFLQSLLTPATDLTRMTERGRGRKGGGLLLLLLKRIGEDEKGGVGGRRMRKKEQKRTVSGRGLLFCFLLLLLFLFRPRSLATSRSGCLSLSLPSSFGVCVSGDH